MSDIAEPGFKASEIISALNNVIQGYTEQEKKALIKKTNGIFELRIKNGGKEAVWTIDLKKTGTVYKGPAQTKSDVTISTSDDTFHGMANGKTDAQKAFLLGKLKVKGNPMLATKLDGVLKAVKVQAKL